MINNVIANWEQILSFGRKYGLPLAKKKAILREYLQTRVLDLIYSEKKSFNIIFTGGTALRFTRNLNRFSEDLDFDLSGGIEFKDADGLIKKVHKNLQKQNIAIDIYYNKTKKRIYHEFRFKNLLFELGISGQKQEKLTIKFDWETFWKGHKREVVLVKRYGHLIKIPTLSLNQFLVQKLFAYIKRKQTQPRDIYDIVWLLGHEAEIDKEFIKKNKLGMDLVEKALQKYKKEENKLKNYKARIRPFLIDENKADKLELFYELLKELSD